MSFLAQLSARTSSHGTLYPGNAPRPGMTLHGHALVAMLRPTADVGGELAALRFDLAAQVAGLRRELTALRDATPSAPTALALTIEQAGRMLGAGRTRIFELLDQGRLRRAPKVGRARMVTRASVEALLDGNRGGDVSKAPLGQARSSGRRR